MTQFNMTTVFYSSEKLTEKMIREKLGKHFTLTKISRNGFTLTTETREYLWENLISRRKITYLLHLINNYIFLTKRYRTLHDELVERKIAELLNIEPVKLDITSLTKSIITGKSSILILAQSNDKIITSKEKLLGHLEENKLNYVSFTILEKGMDYSFDIKEPNIIYHTINGRELEKMLRWISDKISESK